MKEVGKRREPMTLVVTAVGACDCGCACSTARLNATSRSGAKSNGRDGGSGCKCSKKSLFASARD
jgi:hypothetical protein